jgi:hypothetical protein
VKQLIFGHVSIAADNNGI